VKFSNEKARVFDCSSVTRVMEIKDEAIPLQAWTGPLESSRFRLTEFLENLHVQVVRS
jgi:hypothetical protein